MNGMDKEEYWEGLVKKSLCRFLLLSQLAKGPLHGYAVNQAIKEACQGCCEPTEAMVYSTMRELQGPWVMWIARQRNTRVAADGSVG